MHLLMENTWRMNQSRAKRKNTKAQWKILLLFSNRTTY